MYIVNCDFLQIIKPHSQPLTCISMNPTNSVLVTGGTDSTIFIFKLDIKLDCAVLVPIGYVPSPDVPSCIIWKPDYVSR